MDEERLIKELTKNYERADAAGDTKTAIEALKELNQVRGQFAWVKEYNDAITFVLGAMALMLAFKPFFLFRHYCIKPYNQQQLDFRIKVLRVDFEKDVIPSGKTLRISFLKSVGFYVIYSRFFKKNKT